MSNVPCNGCRKCCIGDAVRVLPGEDFTRWETEPHPSMPGQRMLAHKDSGECIYLGESGCTIHDDKPRQCRQMDCRNITRQVPFKTAKDAGILHIWKQGKKLIARSGD